MQRLSSRLLRIGTAHFNVVFANVILTGGDDSMYAAIASLPYSDNVQNLLCTFHLFELNVKKKVIRILQAMGSGNGSQ